MFNYEKGGRHKGNVQNSYKPKKTDNAISKNPLQTASKTKYKDTRTPLKTGASKDTTLALNVSFVICLSN